MGGGGGKSGGEMMVATSEWRGVDGHGNEEGDGGNAGVERGGGGNEEREGEGVIARR